MGPWAGGAAKLQGERPDTEMPTYLSSDRAPVIPSIYKGTSIASLETMACETPLAASNIGGLPEIVRDGGTGRLFAPGNPADIAEEVIWLLRQDRAELGKRTPRNVIDNWNVRILVDRHMEVYQGLASKRSSR